MSLIDSSTTWTGKDADGWYSLAVLTGDSKARVRQMPNVKSKEKIASLELGSFLQDDSCSVDASGDHTITDKTVTVCDLAFNLEICAKDYENMYLSETMKPGSNTENQFPNGLVDYIKNQIADKTNAEIERLMWKGSTTASPADKCDGILKGLVANTTEVVKLGSPLTLSESNIIAELTRIVKVIPKTIQNKSKNDVKIFMSTRAARYYELAIYATHPALIRYDEKGTTLSFAGYEIIETPGLYDSTIVVTDPMNLIFASDLAKDSNQIDFKQNPIPGKEMKYNFIGRFKIGFNFVKGSEIVLYGGTA